MEKNKQDQKTPNEQKSDVGNSNNNPPHGNNKDYKGKIDNRSTQKNPNKK